MTASDNSLCCSFWFSLATIYKKSQVRTAWPPPKQSGVPTYLDSVAREEASAAFLRYYKTCRDVPSICYEQASRQKDTVPRYRFLTDKANVALVALAPIVLGWLLAYALVYLRRCVRAGSRH